MLWWLRMCGLVLLALAPPAPATDAESLKGLHQKVIDAHLRNSVDLLLEDESADYVVANRGEVSRPTFAERRNRLGPYLSRTAFREYRDATEPIVAVSADGTMGWVVAQVHVRGEGSTPDGKKQAVEFTSAWIELYQKRDGRWYRVGNVSNFKE